MSRATKAGSSGSPAAPASCDGSISEPPDRNCRSMSRNSSSGPRGESSVMLTTLAAGRTKILGFGHRSGGVAPLVANATRASPADPERTLRGLLHAPAHRPLVSTPSEQVRLAPPGCRRRLGRGPEPPPGALPDRTARPRVRHPGQCRVRGFVPTPDHRVGPRDLPHRGHPRPADRERAGQPGRPAGLGRRRPRVGGP
ncbi:hypothetical protein FRIGORI9N_370066 [Frigoribacterium sp. 9N]|nr:hypothetical protein FRIGORI9N_370066 [Frigoribacterium sp. 9N]